MVKITIENYTSNRAIIQEYVVLNSIKAYSPLWALSAAAAPAVQRAALIAYR